MADERGVFVGQSMGSTPAPEILLYGRANRHGLVAGATGTGKTVTLQILAQAFSDAGVPVFAADIKGDLSGIGVPGTPNEKLLSRAQGMGLDLVPAAAPVVFWDLFGKSGHPIRATISDMGPLLLSRLLELNDTQEGVLNIVFHVAEKEGLLLLDLADLRTMLSYVGENAKAISLEYGQVSATSVAAIQRALLTLQTQGGDSFFGEPALDLHDLMRTTRDGKGYVNVLCADRLIQSPKLYSTFLLWLMSQLFEKLPEVGDPEKPKMVFFFDEAHLLFKEANRALLDKIEQVVRLIRSKGVGIYFITQNPADIPDAVLAQLGNRIQHALRAYTPSEQKGLKAAAQSFRANPEFDTQEAIQGLGTGEALVSLLDEKGRPNVTQRTLIRPPASRLGPATEEERVAIQGRSPVSGLYDTPKNRESAHEILSVRLQKTRADAEEAEREEQIAEEEARQAKADKRSGSGMGGMLGKALLGAVVTIATRVGTQVVKDMVRGGTKRATRTTTRRKR